MKTLIGYEYKKIFIRKSTWIVLIFAMLLTLFSCIGDLTGSVYVEGKRVSSHYQEFTTDRAYARELSGRKVDKVLISEMQEAYKKVPNVPLYTKSQEYQMYARPYSTIYHLVRKVATNNLDNESNSLMKLDGNLYNDLRNKAIIENLKGYKLTEAELQKHLDMNKNVDTPFVFQYADGYRSIMSRMYTIGMILILTLAICLAPIFANECSDRMDQLILTARYGKNKAIIAKLLTGISFGVIVSIVMLLMQSLPTLMVYGFDGWNASLQIINVMTTYPFTVLESLLILFGMAILASMLIVCLCMYLSARLKSAFAVIVVISTFTIICMFIRVPEQSRFFYQLVNTLPMNIMSDTGTFSEYFFEVFGKCFASYQAIPVIYGLISIVLLLGSYRSFKNHQIG